MSLSELIKARTRALREEIREELREEIRQEVRDAIRKELNSELSRYRSLYSGSYTDDDQLQILGQRAAREIESSRDVSNLQEKAALSRLPEGRS